MRICQKQEKILSINHNRSLGTCVSQNLGMVPDLSLGTVPKFTGAFFSIWWLFPVFLLKK